MTGPGRSWPLRLLLLVAAGCAREVEPDYRRALEAERAGQWLAAADHYERVCALAPASARCPIARRRAASLRLREAAALLDRGSHGEARALLLALGAEPPASASAPAPPEPPAPAREPLPHAYAWRPDLPLPSAAPAAPSAPAVTSAPPLPADLGPLPAVASALLASDEMTAGLALRAALDEPDLTRRLGRLDDLGRGSTPASASARAAAEALRPGALLAQVKAHCAVRGKELCEGAWATLDQRYPGTPEQAQARDVYEVEQRRARLAVAEAERWLQDNRPRILRSAQHHVCTRQHPELLPSPPPRSCDEQFPVAEQLTGDDERRWRDLLRAVGRQDLARQLQARFRRIENGE